MPTDEEIERVLEAKKQLDDKKRLNFNLAAERKLASLARGNYKSVPERMTAADYTQLKGKQAGEPAVSPAGQQRDLYRSIPPGGGKGAGAVSLNNALNKDSTAGKPSGLNLDAEKDEENALRYKSQPLRGAGSRQAKNAAQSEEEAQGFQDRRMQDMRKSLLKGFGRALMGRVRSGKSRAAKSLYKTALSQGETRVFYYVLGTLAIPPYVTGVVALDFFWLVAKSAGIKLKLWQKLLIIGVNILLVLIILGLIFLILMTYCKFAVYVPDVVAGVAGEEVSASVTFCKNFSKITDYISTAASVSVSATQVKGIQTQIPAVDLNGVFSPRGPR